MKPFMIVIVALGIALLLWLLVWEDHSSQVEEEAAPSNVQTVPAGGSGQAGDAPAPEPISTEPYQEATPPPAIESGPAMEVRVLHEADKVPADGVRVSVYDMALYFQKIRERGVAHGTPGSRLVKAGLQEASVTGPDGVARLPIVAKRMLVEARLEGLWGFAFLTRPPTEPIEILIREDGVLRVRVASADGRSLSGVPIGLRKKNPGQPPYTWKLSETEPPDGIGVFEHMQRRFNQGPGWHATFAFPVRNQPAVPVFEDSLPVEPVELVLPGSGGLEVVVRDSRGQAVGGDQLSLQLAAYSDAGSQEPICPEARWSRPQLDENGRARTRWLGLGLHLHVTATASDPDSERKPVTVQVAGPREDGEVALCELVVPAELAASERYPTVAGRFVRRDGNPWPAVTVRAFVRLFPYESVPDKKIQVDENGRFRFLVKKACPDGGKRRYRFNTTGSAEYVVGWLDLSRDLPPGVTDLGDVILDHGALLVAGHVVDETGQPLSGARVTVTTLVPKSGRDFWPGVDTSGSLTSEKDGSFAAYAIAGEELPVGRTRLRARLAGFIPGANVEFPVGRRDVRYELRRGGALAGSLDLASGQTAEDVSITVRGEELFRSVDVNEDGTFEEGELPRGRVELVASLKAGSYEQRRASRQLVKDLEIFPGVTNRDSRIQGIRVGGEVAKVVVEVVDASGTPLYRACVEALGGGAGSPAFTDQKGKATFSADALPVDVKVTAYGYRRVHLKGLKGDRRVVLKKGLPVLITTNARPHGRKPAYRLGLLVKRIDPSRPMPEWVFHRIRPTGGTFFDERSELRMQFPLPGTYEFQPHVVVLGDVASGGGIGMKPQPRITVRDTPDLQTFHIDLPLNLVDDAVRKYAK